MFHFVFLGLRRVQFCGLAALCFVSSWRRSVSVAEQQGCWAAAGSEAPAALSGREAEAELAQARGRGFSGGEAKAAKYFYNKYVLLKHIQDFCVSWLSYVWEILVCEFPVDNIFSS